MSHAVWYVKQLYRPIRRSFVHTDERQRSTGTEPVCSPVTEPVFFPNEETVSPRQ